MASLANVDGYSPSTPSVRTLTASALLPVWLINPLSIIWSQSITPFYRLSGSITISLSGASLRMADPYQAEATPWTKEPLWSSLRWATNVSISIGRSCRVTVWTGLRFLPAVSGGGGVWWMQMIQFRVKSVDGRSSERAGIPGPWPLEDRKPLSGCSFLKGPLWSEQMRGVVILSFSLKGKIPQLVLEKPKGVRLRERKIQSVLSGMF